MPSENELSRKLLDAIARFDLPPVKLMEVCGTHTMSIAKAGLKSLLPPSVKLVSGPGCPVCVTPAEVIDEILALSKNPSVIVATYGDMLRVPGSSPGESLRRATALGARVEIIYSPMDAVALAKTNTTKEIVFLAAGFETTAPGTAAAVLAAESEGLENFSVLSMLKMVEPALRALITQEGFDINGFLCPGHVAVVTGSEYFSFLPREYNLPAVVAGFSTSDIVASVYALLKQISLGEARLLNEYSAIVRPEGNAAAKAAISRCFTARTDIWRGLGAIDDSGLRLRDCYAAFDAEKKLGIAPIPGQKPGPCRCGDIICGRIEARECPLFGRRCIPEDPVGPCMVSSEGACAAAYKYALV